MAGNLNRPGPYANFRFRVRWNGREVLGLSKVSVAPGPPPEVHPIGPGHVTPGIAPYNAVTLERGVSFDQEFSLWARTVFDDPVAAAGANPSRLDARRNLVIDVYNEADIKVAAYNVFRAWVSAFHGQSERDGQGEALVVESLVVQNEGWIRDPGVDPSDPALTLPAGDAPADGEA